MIADAGWLSAIVLAGGQSSRMGQDKALLEVGGLPLLWRVCTIALHCTPEVYVVTPWQDRYQGKVPASCRFIQEVPLPNAPPSQGPLVGFAQALAHVSTDWVLLLACDLPCLQAEVLQNWMQQLDQIAATTIAALPRQKKGWNPLCGYYRRSCLPGLHDFIAQGGRSFQFWLVQHSVQELELLDSTMLFNCNTPDDLNSLIVPKL